MNVLAASVCSARVANARAACWAATKALVVFMFRSDWKAERVREGDRGSWDGTMVAAAAVCGYQAYALVGWLSDKCLVLLLRGSLIIYIYICIFTPYELVPEGNTWT